MFTTLPPASAKASRTARQQGQQQQEGTVRQPRWAGKGPLMRAPGRQRGHPCGGHRQLPGQDAGRAGPDAAFLSLAAADLTRRNKLRQSRGDRVLLQVGGHVGDSLLCRAGSVGQAAPPVSCCMPQAPPRATPPVAAPRHASRAHRHRLGAAHPQMAPHAAPRHSRRRCPGPRRAPGAYSAAACCS